MSSIPATPAQPGFLTDQSLRLMLFGGKGGVGKTTAACAAAIAIADSRPAGSFILISTDPAHSVRDALDGPGSLPKNLKVIEFDAASSHQSFMAEHLEHFRTLASRGTFFDNEDVDSFLALALPGLDELMAFLQIATWAHDETIDGIIVDTAPTGHTLRLLQMPEMFTQWMDAIDALMAKHRYMANLFSKARSKDELDTFLEHLQFLFSAAHELLTDPVRCRFVPVCNAEVMSIAETTDLVCHLSELGVPHAEIIINRLITPGHSGYLDLLRCQQATVLSKLVEPLASAEHWGLPLTQREPVGPDSLRSLLPILMSPAEVCSLAATCPAVAPRIDLAEPVHGHIGLELSSAAQIMFFAGKGGVGKTTMACAAACEMATAGIGKVLLVSVDPAHSVADCIDQPLDATARQIAPNLFAMELDAASEFQLLKDEYQQELEVMLQNILGGASLAFDEDAMRSLLDLAPPGIDEVMAIVKIIDLLGHHDFDKVVIDTAPTGHLLRLLELPHLATQWLDATFKLLLKYKSMIRLPKVTKRLVELSKGVKRLSAMLTDPAQSAIVPVAIPTKLALDETGDLIRACTGKAAPAPSVNLGGTPAPAPEPIRVYIPGIIVNQISTPPEGEPGDPLLTALIRRETAMVERFRTLAGATPLALVSRHGPPRGLDRLSVLGHQLFTVSTRSPVRQ